MSPSRIASTVIIESAWEVCNQVGGIYTVIRTKIPSIKQQMEPGRYVLVGPYFAKEADAVIDPLVPDESPIGKTIEHLRAAGWRVQHGIWLVSGRPEVVLIDPSSAPHSDAAMRDKVNSMTGAAVNEHDQLMRDVLRFGFGLFEFCRHSNLLFDEAGTSVIYHFHEWMAGLPLSMLKQDDVKESTPSPRTVFTTHATLLGRYLAMQKDGFYERLESYDWKNEASRFGIGAAVGIERAAANNATVFTTVSAITAEECKHLLGRTPDLLLPNGINSSRFEALHEFQNLHKINKERIHALVMGHFFRHKPIDLDKTLYFFTSGRYEYRNKGFDITLDSLRILNDELKALGLPINIVVFFITRAPFHSINPEVLQSRAMLEELRSTCNAIADQVKQNLLYRALTESSARMPDLNSCVDDYYRLRLRRTLQSWHSEEMPFVTTHNMVDDQHDEILCGIRRVQLFNYADDPVKIVYHPDFISQISPLFGMEYAEFVRGCHLGIFPSYYEPWGYTPLECVSSGIPAVTSNLSGFGDYVQKTMKVPRRKGLYVLNRKNRSYQESARDLARFLLDFAKHGRRERIELRNRTEAAAPLFDWERLIKHYQQAYTQALR